MSLTRRLENIILTVLTFSAALVWIFPLYWTFVTSIRSDENVAGNTLLIPDEFRLSYFGGPAVIEQLTVSVVPGSRVLGLSQHDEPPAEHLEVGPLHNGSAITFRAATGQRASAVFQVRAEPWEPVVVRADQ